MLKLKNKITRIFLEKKMDILIGMDDEQETFINQRYRNVIFQRYDSCNCLQFCLF